MARLNKGDLVAEAARDLGVSQKSVIEAVDNFLAKVARGAANGHVVHLHGFGTFEVKDRPARTGRNPQTGEPVDIPASSKLTFRAARKGGA